MSRTKPIPSPFLILCLAALAACHTTGFERAERTTASMRGLDTELALLNEQVSMTRDTLGELATDADADMRSLYQVLGRGVERLEAYSKKVERRTSNLDSRGKAYFAAWDETLEEQTDEELRSLSATRRAESQAAFEEVQRAVGEVHVALGSYRTDLKEIQTFLDTNLSRSGIQAIGGKIERVQEAAAPVGQQIDAASRALGAWTREWAPPPPAAPEEAAEEEVAPEKE